MRAEPEKCPGIFRKTVNVEEGEEERGCGKAEHEGVVDEGGEEGKVVEMRPRVEEDWILLRVKGEKIRKEVRIGEVR